MREAETDTLLESAYDIDIKIENKGWSDNYYNIMQLPNSF